MQAAAQRWQQADRDTRLCSPPARTTPLHPALLLPAHHAPAAALAACLLTADALCARRLPMRAPVVPDRSLFLSQVLAAMPHGYAATLRARCAHPVPGGGLLQHAVHTATAVTAAFAHARLLSHATASRAAAARDLLGPGSKASTSDGRAGIAESKGAAGSGDVTAGGVGGAAGEGEDWGAVCCAMAGRVVNVGAWGRAAGHAPARQGMHHTFGPGPSSAMAKQCHQLVAAAFVHCVRHALQCGSVVLAAPQRHAIVRGLVCVPPLLGPTAQALAIEALQLLFSATLLRDVLSAASAATQHADAASDVAADAARGQPAPEQLPHGGTAGADAGSAGVEDAGRGMLLAYSAAWTGLTVQAAPLSAAPAAAADLSSVELCLQWHPPNGAVGQRLPAPPDWPMLAIASAREAGSEAAQSSPAAAGAQSTGDAGAVAAALDGEGSAGVLASAVRWILGISALSLWPPSIDKREVRCCSVSPGEFRVAQRQLVSSKGLVIGAIPPLTVMLVLC